MHLVHLSLNKTVNITHNAAVLAILFELAEKDNDWIEEVVGSVFDQITHKGKKDQDQFFIKIGFSSSHTQR